jgi:ABC-type transport system involved in multi-copper enzyme maturation permease subunit
MIASLAWKEYREQRRIWLTIALLAGVLIFAALEYPIGRAGPGPQLLTLITICFTLSIGYGLVVGALLIAGERESGTLDFLDTSAGRRLTIWATKTIVGAAGVLVLSVVLAAVLVWRGVSGSLWVPALEVGGWGWLRELPLWSLYAFVAGLLASATSRSVFRAAGLGLCYSIAFLLCGLLLSLLLAMAFTVPEAFNGILRGVMVVVALAILYGSYRLSCAVDLLRGTAVSEPTAANAPGHARLAMRLRPVIWLVWKQGRSLMIGAIVAVAAALIALSNLLVVPVAGRLMGIMSWPPCALVIGVVAGMAAFAGEQASQANRFLGDQRLPIGRIWLLKTLTWLLFAAMVSLVISSGSSFRFFGLYPNGNQDMTLWPSRLNAARWLLLALCVSYGFALGQFLVLLLQRPPIACFLAMIASFGSLVWVPSLVAGGAHWYAVLLPPVVLLCGTSLLMRPWAAGFPTAKGLTISLTTSVLCVASLALGIGQRVWEIPDVPLPFNVERYSKSLSTPLGTQAGVLTHSALHEMQQRIDLARWRFGFAAQEGPYRADQLPWRVDQVTASNMPVHDKELEEVLEFVCAGDWIPKLSRLKTLPRGAIMDPRETKTIWTTSEMQQAKEATIILCNHGRIREQQGQLEGAQDDYETALELVLTMAHQANDYGFLESDQAAHIALDRLNHWGTKAHESGLLGRARAIIERFEASLPSSVDVDKASYLATKSFLSQPELLAHEPAEPTIARDNTLSLAPWEAERRLRLLNALFAGRIKASSLPFAEWVKNYQEWLSGARTTGRFWIAGWIAPTSNGLAIVSSQQLGEWLQQTWWQSYVSPWGIPFSLAKLQASVRATQLRFALINYAVENRRVAATLADLVPKYIENIPADPYDGKPFRYRLSAGEEIVSVGGHEVPKAARKVRPGQGILWCVGPDLIDDHGAVEDKSDWFSIPKKRTGDIVFIVPTVNDLLR